MDPICSAKETRQQAIESYRLWFEFLKRAIEQDRSKVRLDLYEAWGSVEDYAFRTWWSKIGSKVIDVNPAPVELVEAGKADDVSYLLRVSRSMTSTDLATEVRKFLIGIKHQPIQGSSLRIKVGAEIRPQHYRALLRTYDEQRKLEKKNPGKKITGAELLVEVRKFYLDTEQKQFSTGRVADSFYRYDKIPPAIASGMKFTNPYEIDSLDDEAAIATVKRYLRNANTIIEAVRHGRFPE
jgi:hypothetical protein